jgi:glutamine synthetase
VSSAHLFPTLTPSETANPSSDASATAGIEFLVGFELEFILLKSTNPITAINEHNWSASAALYTGTKESLVLQEIVDALQESGVEVQMYHPETAPGQVRSCSMFTSHPQTSLSTKS